MNRERPESRARLLTLDSRFPHESLHRQLEDAQDAGRRRAPSRKPCRARSSRALRRPDRDRAVADSARRRLPIRAGRWSLGCQNVAAEREGAHTGEVSAIQCFDAGCRWAIVGHSERRREFGEDEALLAQKLARCREAGLVPVFCVGETADERDRGLTESVLARQVSALSADPPVGAARRRLRTGLGDRGRPLREPGDAGSARAAIRTLLPDSRGPARALRRLRVVRQRAGAARRVGRGRVPDRRREPPGRRVRGHRPGLRSVGHPAPCHPEERSDEDPFRRHVAINERLG